MILKDKLLAVVRAFVTLVQTSLDQTAALEQAKADAKAAVEALAAEQAGNTLTPAEATEVDSALNIIGAATPPPPAPATV